MKKILSKVIKKIQKDNRGMSLVEVLCAVAILALISGVIGSVIVISTRTYSRGVSETNIQQEAQLAANNIGDIVRDACGIIYAESGADYTKNGEVYKEDGTPQEPDPVNPAVPKKGAAGVTELSILTNDQKQYTVKYYDSSDANGERKETLWYEIIDSRAVGSVSQQLMAKNISQFKADTSSFQDSKSIQLDMIVKDGDREIPMKYTMTSRNGVGEGVTYTPTADSASIKIDESEIVLVPGQTYSIAFSVWGGIQEDELKWASSTGFEVDDFKIGVADSETGVIDGTAGSVSVKVPADTSQKTVPLTIKAVDSAGTEKATAYLTVHVRKVESVKVNYSVNTDNTEHGTMEEENAVYTFNANVSGYRLAKDVAYDYDKGYVTAEAVVWSFRVHTDDKDIVREWVCTENAGKWEFTPVYNVDSGGRAEDAFNIALAEYIEIMQEQGDAVYPNLTIKLKRNMPVGYSLTVRATSKHALGANKADSAYGNKDDSQYYDEVVIKPRPTIVKGAKYVVLEPGEDITIDDFKMLGAGMPGNVEIDYSNGSSSDTRSDSGTVATYNSADRSVTIYVGMDERGSKIGTETQKVEIIDDNGKTKEITKTVDTWDYNVYVNLKTDGNILARIIVCISRIDYMSLEKEEPPLTGEAGESGSDKSYRFNVRFNTISEKKLKSRLRYLTSDEETTKRNLATKFIITYKNTATDKILKETEVIVDGAGNVIDNAGNVLSSDKYKEEGWQKEYSILVTSSLGTKKESDTNGSDSGYEFINPSSTPHVYVSPAKDELPMNRRLTVRAEVMHPRGLNNAGNAYYGANDEKDGYKYWDLYLADEKSFEGPKGIVVDSEIVVVEPNQKLEIPVTAPAGETVKAEILGACSDNQTKIAMKGTGEKSILSVEVGKDELGNQKTGTIQVKLISDKGAEKTVTLLLRRVNEVKWNNNKDLVITKSEEASKKNVKGQQVTLKVDLEGYRNITVKTDEGEQVTVDPFAKQQVEYDPYISPYEIKWEMEISGVKPLGDWKDYVEKVKEGTDGEIQTISFKLKKQLPSGTKIRAYSLHALGDDGGKKYNKSQKEYSKEVYAEFEIQRLDLAADCDFQRYNEQNYNLPGFENIPNFEGPDTHWSDQQVFFRYRTVNGTWSQYYREDEGSGFKPQIDGGKMGKVFRTDTEYEIDYVLVVFNQSEKKIYWPLDDDTLLATGMGFKEKGFSLADWDYEKLLSDEQKNFKCRQEYFIAKTELYIAPYPDADRGQTANRQTIPKRAQSAGTEKKPILVDGNGNGTQEKWFSVNMDPYAFCLHAFQGNFKVLVDKKTDNGWESIALSTMQNTEHWLAQAQNPEITAGYTYGAKGTYRLRAYIDNIEWQKPSGDMFYPTYVSVSTETMNLYDDSGIGTIYVKFE